MIFILKNKMLLSLTIAILVICGGCSEQVTVKENMDTRLPSVGVSKDLNIKRLPKERNDIMNRHSELPLLDESPTVNVKPPSEDSLNFEQALQRFHSILSSEETPRVQASQYVSRRISNEVSSNLTQWFDHWGHARVSLDLSPEGQLSKGSSIDVLFPLSQTDDRLFFEQGSWGRYNDSRQIVNIGLGVRSFMDNSVFGMNTFYDDDLTGHNHRAGVGMEFWTPYARSFTNAYWRLNGWHKSRDFDNYDERPANGFDMGANLYLPRFPQLGFKLKLEKYYGDNVALFDKNKLQKNPYAGDIGLTYTPFTLFSVGATWRQGNQDAHDLLVDLGMNYRFGVPLSEQLSPSSLKEIRSLSGSKYDFVERSNNIVLDYRKKQFIRLTLDGPLKGTQGSILPINTTVSSTEPLKTILWNASELYGNGGDITQSGDNIWQVKLPTYNYGGTNNYTIHGTAVDIRGNESQPASAQVIVMPPKVNSGKSLCRLSVPALPADNTSTSELICELKDENGVQITGMSSSLKVLVKAISSSNKADAGSSSVRVGPFTEQQAGVYEATVTAGLFPGRFSLEPYVDDVTLNKLNLTLTSTVVRFHVASIDVSPAESVIVYANGSDHYIYTATILDEEGNPVINQSVPLDWSKNKNNAGLILTPDEMITDAQGHISAKLTSTEAVSDIMVSAKVIGGVNSIDASRKVSFMDYMSSLHLSLSQQNTSEPAGTPEVITAKVTDKQGNIVSGIKIDWQLAYENEQIEDTDLTHSVANDSKTDSNGENTYTVNSTEGYGYDMTLSAKIDGTDINKSVQLKINATMHPVTRLFFRGYDSAALTYRSSSSIPVDEVTAVRAGMTVILDVNNNDADYDANGGFTLSTDNADMIEVSSEHGDGDAAKNANYYFKIKKTGTANLYITYQIHDEPFKFSSFKMNLIINNLVHPDPEDNFYPISGSATYSFSGGYYSWISDIYPKTCLNGLNSAPFSFGTQISQWVKNGTDLAKIGLLGNSIVSNVYRAGFYDGQTYRAYDGSDYYPETSRWYLMICFTH